MIRAAEHLAPKVGLASACRALGVARASVYRHRKPRPTCPGRSRRSSPRALSPEERVQVLDILHEDRFSDRAPAAVYATLLEEGRYVCSIRTMYRLLHDAHEVRERRDQLRHPRLEPPRLMARAPPGVDMGHHAVAGTPKMGDVSPLRGVGSVLALRRGLDGRHQGERHAGQAADYQRLCQAGHSTRTTDAAPGPRRSDEGEVVFANADRSRHPGQLQPTSRFGRQPLFRKPIQNTQIRAVIPRALHRSAGSAYLLPGLFFPWYNTQHRHSGLGLLTPDSVHYGRTQQIQADRQHVLDHAYRNHPERFVQGKPRPPHVPDQVWINQPNNTIECHQLLH